MKRVHLYIISYLLLLSVGISSISDHGSLSDKDQNGIEDSLEEYEESDSFHGGTFLGLDLMTKPNFNFEMVSPFVLNNCTGIVFPTKFSSSKLYLLFKRMKTDID